MKRKLTFAFVLVAAIGVGMWALIFATVSGNIGGSGRPLAVEDKPVVANNAEETRPASAELNWGLSFQQEGKPPAGNATSQYLKDYKAYYIDEAGTKDKTIYLTFDAGYENGHTEKILDVLKEEKVPAVFFLVGNYITDNPKLVKRMATEGHTVGNHTMHHPDMAAIADKEAFRKELTELESVYQTATGEKMKKVYRPPQGKYSEGNLKQAAEMGYTTVFWSLAYVDWYEDKQPAREDALNILNKRIHPGAIVLLHSTSKTNSEILQELIQGWKKDGYKFGHIDNFLT